MSRQLVDTHCHLHDSEFYPENREEAYQLSREAGVTMLCVGTGVKASGEAIEFCASHEQCYPIVGIHPHETTVDDPSEIRRLVEAHRDEIVGIGEIGLDYYYDHSPRESQLVALRAQLQIAADFDLPVSFHVREASSTEGRASVWRDFWSILDDFPMIRGVLHSFTDTEVNLQEALKRGFKIGVNGISTFTKNPTQQRLFASLPLEHILLETDAPFLTPVPLRGKMNIPAYVGRVAEHQAHLKGCSLDEVARTTTDNARELFGISL